MKKMKRIFDVRGRDQQLAAANIVRSCPGDWKQGDGAALACIRIGQNTIKARGLPLISFVFFMRLAGSLS
jgi:hypothetical protein